MVPSESLSRARLGVSEAGSEPQPGVPEGCPAASWAGRPGTMLVIRGRLVASAVAPVSGRELSLLLKPPSLLLFNHSSSQLTVHSQKGEHAVPHGAGAPNGVCQESGHQLSLDCQVIFLLR